VDVITARQTANVTIQALQVCRNENSFDSLWRKAHIIGDNIKKWLEPSEVSFRELRLPRKQQSRVTKPLWENQRNNQQQSTQI